jgi:hypothetical protein
MYNEEIIVKTALFEPESTHPAYATLGQIKLVPLPSEETIA